jgi:hypothetical protein
MGKAPERVRQGMLRGYEGSTASMIIEVSCEGKCKDDRIPHPLIQIVMFIAVSMNKRHLLVLCVCFMLIAFWHHHG